MFAVEVMGNGLLWHQIAAYLPVGMRARCVLVSRDVDRAVIGDEPSYSLSRLCNVLEGHFQTHPSPWIYDLESSKIETTAVEMVELCGGSVEGQKELRRSLKPFLSRLDSWWKLRSSYRSPPSAEALWKLMLLEPGNSFLRTRAHGTRVAHESEACEIGWTPLHLACAKGNADGV